MPAAYFEQAKKFYNSAWDSSIVFRMVFYPLPNSKGFTATAYNNIAEGIGISEPLYLSWLNRLYLKNPYRLLADNVIGPPSVVLYKREDKTVYDKQLKWLVDIDFYIRYLKGKSFYYINRPVYQSIGLVQAGWFEECYSRWPEARLGRQDVYLHWDMGTLRAKKR